MAVPQRDGQARPGDANDMLDTGELKQEAAWLYEVSRSSAVPRRSSTSPRSPCSSTRPQAAHPASIANRRRCRCGVIGGRPGRRRRVRPPRRRRRWWGNRTCSDPRAFAAPSRGRGREPLPRQASRARRWALAVNVAAAEQSEAELLFLCNAGLSIAEVFTTVVSTPPPHRDAHSLLE